MKMKNKSVPKDTGHVKGGNAVEQELEDEDGCAEECTGEKPAVLDAPITPEQQLEAIINWEPPARYCIRAGGMDVWCDNVKPNASGLGVDIIWIQKIKGVATPVSGTIFDTNIMVFDYETSLTAEVFEHIKKTSFDYALQMAQEAKMQEEAKKTNEKKAIPIDSNGASYV
jgi:hypothetical protein